MTDEARLSNLESRAARTEQSVEYLTKDLGRLETYLERRITVLETHLERRIDESVKHAADRIEERYSLIRAAVLSLFAMLAYAFVQYLIAGWKEPKPPGAWIPPPYHSTNEIKERPR